MSVDFYCYRELPGGTQFADEDHTVNLANWNAAMVLRSLGYTLEQGMAIDPDELRAKLDAAIVKPPVTDDGMPHIARGNFTYCGVRPGYFVSVYQRLNSVVTQAKAWGVPVIVA